MKPQETPKTWTPTRHQNLVRHKSGRYYARAFAGGKEFWKSLKTSHFSVAKARLAEFLKDHRERRSNSNSEGSAKMTLGEALKIHQRNQVDNLEIKPSTLHYWSQIFAALLKSWPGLEHREIRRITKTDCEEWARKFRKTVSPTRWNNTLSGLRHVFDVAIRAGIIYRNPAAAPGDERHSPLKRVTPNKKIPDLPSRADFFRLLDTIRNAGGGRSPDCADFVEGLATTGVRIGEAGEIEWRDLDFDKGETVVRGDPETGTKNWEVRRVPMIPRAKQLFERMRVQRHDEALTAKVFRVREAQRSINNACKKLGLKRITHHGLRHLFATTCIESGIDIPTVAKWFGHKDGGKVLLDTYGHLRREHSVAQAQKVTFETDVTKKADVIPFPATAQ